VLFHGLPFCLQFKMMDLVLYAVTVHDGYFSPSASKRVKNSELAFCMVCV
jgi:hypothetical protein